MLAHFQMSSYAGAVTSGSQGPAPTRMNWAPLTGQYDPKNWVRDVWESHGDRLVAHDGGFSHTHGWPADEAGVLEAVSVEVNEMLQGLGHDEVGPNPFSLAQGITYIILDILRRS